MNLNIKVKTQTLNRRRKIAPEPKPTQKNCSTNIGVNCKSRYKQNMVAMGVLNKFSLCSSHLKDHQRIYCSIITAKATPKSNYTKCVKEVNYICASIFLTEKTKTLLGKLPFIGIFDTTFYLEKAWKNSSKHREHIHSHHNRVKPVVYRIWHP